MDIKRGIFEHKAFWGLFVTAIFFSVIFSLGGDVNITGHAIQNVAYMQTGAVLQLDIDSFGLKTIYLTVLDDVKNSKVFVEEVEELSWDFDGTVYSTFEVSSLDADKFGDLELTLKIKDADLYDVGINRNEVKLFFEGNELETTLTEIKNDYVYYEASAEKMGEFVIGKAEVVEAAVAQPSEVIEEPVEVVEPEVQEPTVLPVEEEDGFFAWVKNLFN
jgi:PGF-pre-PGF domain-containing protein